MTIVAGCGFTKYPRDLSKRGVGNPVQINRSFQACLRKVNRQFRKPRAAGNVGAHDFRAAREKRNVDVVKYIRRNDLRNLDLTGKLLKQSRVLFGFEQNETADWKTASFEHVLQLFAKQAMSIRLSQYSEIF